MDESKHRSKNGIDGSGQWMLVELLGHNRVAGFVTEEQRFGQVLLRIDIPTEINFETKKMGYTTQLYGTHALYCATPINESDAIQLARSLRPKPFDKFDLHRESNRNLDEFKNCPDCGGLMNVCSECGTTVEFTNENDMPY
jgi:hypothetical protein